jgi:hypothetical protein
MEARKLEKIRKLFEADYPATEVQVLREVQKILGKPPKLFALAHDCTLDGDSAFYAPDDRIEFKEGQTIRDVRLALHERRVKLDTGDEKISPALLRDIIDETNETYTNEIKGAWVVTEDTIELLKEIWEAIDPGNDSATYRANHLCKHMAKKFAIKTLGRKAQ